MEEEVGYVGEFYTVSERRDEQMSKQEKESNFLDGSLWGVFDHGIKLLYIRIIEIRHTCIFCFIQTKFELKRQ